MNQYIIIKRSSDDTFRSRHANETEKFFAYKQLLAILNKS